MITIKEKIKNVKEQIVEIGDIILTTKGNYLLAVNIGGDVLNAGRFISLSASGIGNRWNDESFSASGASKFLVEKAIGMEISKIIKRDTYSLSIEQ